MGPTIRDHDDLLAKIGRPPWLTDMVIERLGLDDLFSRAYSLGVEHGRAQVTDERALADELQAVEAWVAEAPNRPTAGHDFATDHLTGKAKEVADAIVAYMTESLGCAPSGGGCRAFYTPEEWSERGEDHGTSSILVLAHDGGDLGPFCNYDHESYEAVEGLVAALEPLGVYIECCTSWYSAVYPIPGC